MQQNTYVGCLVPLDDAAPPESPASPVLPPSGGGPLPESCPLVYGDPTDSVVYTIEHVSTVTHVEVCGIDERTSVHCSNVHNSDARAGIEHTNRVGNKCVLHKWYTQILTVGDAYLL